MKTILFNGKVQTGDGGYCEALLMEDGVITAVGTNAEILELADETTKSLDLGGRLVLPGFNDSHMHFLNVGYNFSQVDLGKTKSIAEALELCREYIRQNNVGKGRWVQCFDWNEDNWSDKRPLDRRDLDQISTEHPILAARVCTHATAVNSKALELLNIRKGSPQPETGAFEVDRDGEPTGMLYEMLSQVSSIIPEPTVEEIKKMIADMGRSASAKGLTSV